MTSTNPGDLPHRVTALDLRNGRDWLQAAESAYSKGDIDQSRAAAMIGAGYVTLANAVRAVASSATLDAAAERVRRAAAEARPHASEPALQPRTDKDCSSGAFLRLECDLQLDGASVLSLHKVGSDVHLRVWHAGSDEYAVAVLGQAFRRDVVNALTEFDTSAADRG